MKFAAIDIGSNAIRLLFCNVIENGETYFKKAELIRVPVRLGDDSFLHKEISKEKADKLVSTMIAFSHLMKVFEPVDYRACATSAMRDAANGKEIIERIKLESGLDVEIIDGKKEAELIYSNHIAEHLEEDKSYIYIDVGGGSTEVTLFSNHQIVASKSFNIGTIRMLHQQIDKEQWNDFKEWVKQTTTPFKPIMAIGSGGNINKIYKMLRKKDKPIHFTELKALSDQLNALTFDDRMKKLGLNPDRADVIVPAAKIFRTVMKAAEAPEIIVPQIGLSDGIVHLLYEKYKASIEFKV
jgi:exopolyphosphatase/guanosine-5'-triphosphate,3'-diphosphate pyrophosphatase